MSSGNGPAIRLAVSREDVDHIYVDEIKEYSLNAGFTEILTDHDIVDHGIILKLKS